MIISYTTYSSFYQSEMLLEAVVMAGIITDCKAVVALNRSYGLTC